MIPFESLSAQQQEQLAAINEQMKSDYKIRREALLKRLGVTLQCFTWSPKGKVLDQSRYDGSVGTLVD